MHYPHRLKQYNQQPGAPVAKAIIYKQEQEIEKYNVAEGIKQQYILDL
jgi:hypothetical protein